MLLIDLGNSTIKTRNIGQGGVNNRAFSLRESDYLSNLKDYLGGISASNIYMASVSDEQTEIAVVELLVEQKPDAHIHHIVSLPELDGLINNYDDFRQLGVDRWLALLAARHLMATDCIIVDAGSAITIELLSHEEGFLGGIIMPGFRTDQIRFKQLFPSIDFTDKALKILSKPGRNTRDCLYFPDSPVTVDLITDLIIDWQLLLQPPFRILLTGQDAEVISQQLSSEHLIVPDLVFQGMLKQIELLG